MKSHWTDRTAPIWLHLYNTHPHFLRCNHCTIQLCLTIFPFPNCNFNLSPQVNLSFFSPLLYLFLQTWASGLSSSLIYSFTSSLHSTAFDTTHHVMSCHAMYTTLHIRVIRHKPSTCCFSNFKLSHFYSTSISVPDYHYWYLSIFVRVSKNKREWN